MVTYHLTADNLTKSHLKQIVDMLNTFTRDDILVQFWKLRETAMINLTAHDHSRGRDFYEENIHIMIENGDDERFAQDMESILDIVQQIVGVECRGITIQDPTVKKLADTMRKQRRKQILRLEHCTFTETSWRHMLYLIRDNLLCKITVLSYTPAAVFTDIACELMRNTSSIVSLDIPICLSYKVEQEDCNITDVFCSMLKTNTTLRVINVHLDRFQHADMKTIVETAARNTTLHTFRLGTGSPPLTKDERDSYIHDMDPGYMASQLTYDQVSAFMGSQVYTSKSPLWRLPYVILGKIAYSKIEPKIKRTMYACKRAVGFSVNNCILDE